eukprot:PhM_4_TR7985/c0_g1_i1/m.83593
MNVVSRGSSSIPPPTWGWGDHNTGVGGGYEMTTTTITNSANSIVYVNAIKNLVNSSGTGCAQVLVDDPSFVFANPPKLMWANPVQPRRASTCVFEVVPPPASSLTNKEHGSATLHVSITPFASKSFPKVCHVATSTSSSFGFVDLGDVWPLQKPQTGVEQCFEVPALDAKKFVQLSFYGCSDLTMAHRIARIAVYYSFPAPPTPTPQRRGRAQANPASAERTPSESRFRSSLRMSMSPEALSPTVGESVVPSKRAASPVGAVAMVAAAKGPMMSAAAPPAWHSPGQHERSPQHNHDKYIVAAAHRCPPPASSGSLDGTMCREIDIESESTFVSDVCVTMEKFEQVDDDDDDDDGVCSPSPARPTQLAASRNYNKHNNDEQQQRNEFFSLDRVREDDAWDADVVTIDATPSPPMARRQYWSTSTDGNSSSKKTHNSVVDGCEEELVSPPPPPPPAPSSSPSSPTTTKTKWAQSVMSSEIQCAAGVVQGHRSPGSSSPSASPTSHRRRDEVVLVMTPRQMTSSPAVVLADVAPAAQYNNNNNDEMDASVDNVVIAEFECDANDDDRHDNTEHMDGQNDATQLIVVDSSYASVDHNDDDDNERNLSRESTLRKIHQEGSPKKKWYEASGCVLVDDYETTSIVMSPDTSATELPAAATLERAAPRNHPATTQKTFNEPINTQQQQQNGVTTTQRFLTPQRKIYQPTAPSPGFGQMPSPSTTTTTSATFDASSRAWSLLVVALARRSKSASATAKDEQVTPLDIFRFFDTLPCWQQVIYEAYSTAENVPPRNVLCKLFDEMAAAGVWPGLLSAHTAGEVSGEDLGRLVLHLASNDLRAWRVLLRLQQPTSASSRNCSVSPSPPHSSSNNHSTAWSSRGRERPPLPVPRRPAPAVPTSSTSEKRNITTKTDGGAPTLPLFNASHGSDQESPRQNRAQQNEGKGTAFISDQILRQMCSGGGFRKYHTNSNGSVRRVLCLDADAHAIRWKKPSDTDYPSNNVLPLTSVVDLVLGVNAGSFVSRPQHLREVKNSNMCLTIFLHDPSGGKGERTLDLEAVHPDDFDAWVLGVQFLCQASLQRRGRRFVTWNDLDRLRK